MNRIVTKLFILVVLALAGTNMAFAQRTVTGRVTDEGSGIPLPGVNIAIQGTTQGAITDVQGNYSLQVPGPEAILVFSFIGYNTQEIPVGDQNVINVELGEDVTVLEDVVVIGYGTQRKEAITGSVSTVDADDANIGLVTSPDQMLQGRVAGVNITSTNGEPGAGLQVRIRGGTSISASNEPLYVIDGVPVDNNRVAPGGANVSSSAPRNPLNLLNPNDIQSITVLKDASATAIYGSRGANGVVLITTKQGAAGRVTADYEGYVSASSVARKIDLLSASEFDSFVRQQVSAGVLNQEALANLGNASTDWQDAVSQTGVSHFHNLSLSGGATNTQYRASLSYLKQEGAIISSGLERITGRVNANLQALENRLRLATNFTTSFVEDDYLPYQQTSGFEGGLFTNVFAFNPTQPVRVDAQPGENPFFETGRGRQSVRNPVALAEQINDFGKTTRSLGNVSAELDLFQGLTAQVNVGADRSTSSRRAYFPKISPVGAEFGGQAFQRDRELTSKTLQTYLTYTAPLQGQSFDLLGGYEYNDYMTEEFGVESRDFVTDFWLYNNLGGGANEQKPYSFKETNRLVSFFGRANYSFNDRYFLTGVLRYDGSSRFGSGNKWGLFPAVSASWRLSEESFLRGVQALSDLRLRVGYGVVGSQEIGNYNALALLRPDAGARAVIGGVPVTGVAPVTFANENLKWEQTESFNVGIDYGFLNGRFSGTLEYYLKNTNDLLLRIPVPQPAVVSDRLENVGQIRNQGLEFSLDALALADADKSLLFGLVFATEKNEVVDLGTRDQIITGSVSGRGQSGVNAQIIRPGEALGSFYGPVFAGVVDGKQTFEDLDGDGVVEPGSDDRRIIGVARPDFTVGLRTNFTWKNFDMNLFIRGEFGRDVFNNTALVYQTKSSILQSNNFIREALNDPDAVNEAPVYSSRWIENGSFLRFDQFSLGYALPNFSTQVRQARIYLAVNNLWVITPYSGFDPEVNTDAGLATQGIDYTNYPRPRTFTVGVQIGI